jgi:Ca2+-binding EF-hand superfamily protein
LLWRHLLLIRLKSAQGGFRRDARQRERNLLRRIRIPVCKIGAVAVLLLTSVSPALAQSTPQPAQDGMLKSGPPIWDANRDGVYTCDEWKTYAERIFASADRNRDGHLAPSEFATLQKADATLADADFGYFDENQDGKITRKEFVDKPSAFILRFDKNGDCRVTADEIRATNAPKGPQGPSERPRDRFH